MQWLSVQLEQQISAQHAMWLGVGACVGILVAWATLIEVLDRRDARGNPQKKDRPRGRSQV